MIHFVAIDDEPMHNLTMTRFSEMYTEENRADARIALVTTEQQEVL
jgi:hypothetical protein